jgi:RHS repeat-associated protein
MTRVRRPSGGAPTGTNPLCSSTVSGVCSSYYERTWWAGDQILAEWRTADGTPNPTNSGSVGYVHAPGVTSIDAPVAVITSSGTRVITEDWRGLGESSLFPNGAPADNTLYGGTAITVAWPSGRGAYFTPYLGQPSGSSVEHSWLGSLVENGAGAAGLMYRRNRYHDPQSGRFTQQDPIGIAGGVNLYGFAGGDPVNYSDPFGLCPVPILCEAIDIAAVAMDIRDIRQNGLGWGNGLALAADVAAVAIPVVPAGAGALQRGGQRLLPFADADRVREVNATLDRIGAGVKKYGRDGIEFRNREGRLPAKSKGYYSEWTVDTPGASDRAQRRIIRGQGGETYYTDDHYGSFTRIDPRRQ